MRSKLLLYILALCWALMAGINIGRAAGPDPDGWMHLAIAAFCLGMAVVKLWIAQEENRK